MTSAPDLCSFSWTDRDGLHRCMGFLPHEEHHCCCGTTMHPALPAKRPNRKSRRTRRGGTT